MDILYVMASGPLTVRIIASGQIIELNQPRKLGSRFDLALLNAILL